MSDRRERAARRFREDQSDGAAAEAEQIALAGLARTIRIPVVLRYDPAHLRPYDRQVEARFNAYVYEDPAAKFCPHLRPQLYWYLVPGCPVGCAGCVKAWMGANVGPGSDEDTRCDICGHGPNRLDELVQRRLIIRVGVAPPAVPPVCTVTFLVCLGCQAKEAGAR